MEPHLDLAGVAAGYERIAPADLVTEIAGRCARHEDPAIWIHRVPQAELKRRAELLAEGDPATMPLYGVPFAVKDNIDVAGLPTTAACPDFAYIAEHTAPAVQRLLDAGAILVGKTNLDQFATGLVGTRSPYGACRNPFDPRYITGGSSSGSAAAVAGGLVSFALGTDTAGSGRVPAAFCNLVGVKPTLGLVSTRGVVPACRTLDCVSIFAHSCADGAAILDVIAGFDPEEPYARRITPQPARPVRRIGLPRPDQLGFCGDTDYARLFVAAILRLQAQGIELVETDFVPLFEAAALLYQGPWVAERYHAIRTLIETRPEALHPVTHQIIGAGAAISAIDTFDGLYRLAGLKRRSDEIFDGLDALAVPTAPTIWRHDQVEADPIGTNSLLGTYTNFVNLLDLAALAVPAGFRADGLPFGITLIGPAGTDRTLLTLGARLAGEPWKVAPGPANDRIEIAVCGAHMAGLPLNGELLRQGARMVQACRTSPDYRLFALAGGPPARPGLVRTPGGAAIEVEVWSLPAARVGDFMRKVPAPLSIGSIELECGSKALGFLCEAYAAIDAADITAYGGWRRYLAKTLAATHSA